MRLSIRSWPISVRHAPFAAALVLQAALEASGSTFVSLDSERVAKLVEHAAVRGRVAGISRNQTGTELVLNIETNREFVLAIVSEQGTKLKRIPAQAAEVAQDGRPICLYEKGYFVFSGGARLSHEPGAFIKFSPDKSVFFISAATRTNRARVFRTADPEKPLVDLPEAFLPQQIFVSTNQIFVFGQRLDSGRRRSEGHGLVFSRQGPNVKLQRELDLSRFGTVLDMNLSNGLLLVDGKHDLFRTWGIYDPGAGLYKSLGPINGKTGFFLSDGLSKYLENLWK